MVSNNRECALNGNGHGHGHNDYESNGNGKVHVHVNGKGHAAVSKPHLLQEIAGVAGNVLEWYDFAVFGYFSDIIGEVFFPPQKGNRAIVESFAIFGGAFLVRPFGGLILGYVGDVHGRKVALEFSIFLMAVPTFAMGCLPSYAVAGWISPVLLGLTRMLQGASVGGQLMSSLVYTVEHHPRTSWGIRGSYVMAAANVGTLLGGFMGTWLRGALSPEQLKSWGWRVPFWCGLLVSFSGLYLRWYGKEPGHHHHSPHDPYSEEKESNQQESSQESNNPLQLAFAWENCRNLVACSLVPMAWSGGFYMTFVWMAIYMVTLSEHTVPHSFWVNSMALGLSVVLLFPLGGWLSDRWGRWRVMAVGGTGLLLSGPLAVTVISRGDVGQAFVAQCGLGLCLTLWGGPMMAWMVESFDNPRLRLTSIAVGYNIAQGLIGGSCPAVATLLVGTTLNPGILLSIVAGLGLTGLWLAPGTGGGQTMGDLPSSPSTTTTSTTTTTTNGHSTAGERTPLMV